MDSKNVSRRKLLALAASVPVVGAVGGLSFAVKGSEFTPTPRQTEGPFYPRRKPEDIDNDLASFGETDSLAKGTLLELKGRVFDQQGLPVSGARVELWHCDGHGQYHHVGASGPLDKNFQGYGEIVADAEGYYRFRTVKPGVYPGRARHIHFKVVAPGRRVLTSQMYFDSDMGRNLRDGIYRSLSEAERAAVTMQTRVKPDGTNTVDAKLDIILT